MTIPISTLKAGQVVWESERGLNARLTALEDAHRSEDDRGWECQARDENGEGVHLYTADNAGGYGPRLYPVPAYYPPIESVSGKDAMEFPECQEAPK